MKRLALLSILACAAAMTPPPALAVVVATVGVSSSYPTLDGVYASGSGTQYDYGLNLPGVEYTEWTEFLPIVSDHVTTVTVAIQQYSYYYIETRYFDTSFGYVSRQEAYFDIGGVKVGEESFYGSIAASGYEETLILMPIDLPPPVPEPTSALLMALGLAFVAARRVRRHSAPE